MARWLGVASITLLALGCGDPEPYPVQAQWDESLALLPSTYDGFAPPGMLTVTNVGVDTLYWSVTGVTDEAGELLIIDLDGFTEVLPGQTGVGFISPDPRPQLWETGDYSATLELELGYFFAGQELGTSVEASTTTAPEWVSVAYTVQVTWSVDCDLDGDLSDAMECLGLDCDDLDIDLVPGADEVCDEIDNDCDWQVDEDAVDATVWYYDGDLDGFGDEDTLVASCTPPEEQYWVDVAGDCDDASSDANPDAVEICDDGIDNDCANGIDDDCS